MSDFLESEYDSEIFDVIHQDLTSGTPARHAKIIRPKKKGIRVCRMLRDIIDREFKKCSPGSHIVISAIRGEKIRSLTIEHNTQMIMGEKSLSIIVDITRRGSPMERELKTTCLIREIHEIFVNTPL